MCRDFCQNRGVFIWTGRNTRGHDIWIKDWIFRNHIARFDTRSFFNKACIGMGQSLNAPARNLLRIFTIPLINISVKALNKFFIGNGVFWSPETRRSNYSCHAFSLSRKSISSLCLCIVIVSSQNVKEDTFRFLSYLNRDLHWTTLG